MFPDHEGGFLFPGTSGYLKPSKRRDPMDYTFSIIVPVWNEVSTINETINHISTLSYEGDVEVIVVDAGPHGETLRAIQSDRARKIISEKGRSVQMNTGVTHAGGDILLFLHADTRLPHRALQSISLTMSEKDIVAGAFDLGIQSHRPVFRVIEHAASIRSRITRIPYGDQAIFVRREYFESMGGFKEIPLMEDVEFMRRIKRAGHRIYIIPERVKTSPRRWEKEGVLFCTLRNWTLISLYLLGIPPEKLIKFYR
jgi:rSAM/selenodomain-associated transferase 2